MIIEKNDLAEGHQLKSDICIIGGGPAAISIALELKNLGKSITILTGGTWKETGFNQDLHKGLIAKGSSHEPLEYNRRRQFGGGTAAWGGRCLPFEPIDFEKREWIKNSGWPFSYEEILPYFKKASALTKSGKFNFNIDSDEKKREIIPGMDNEALDSTAIERWSPPINFAREFESELRNADNIHIYLDAHVLKIGTDTDAESISYVQATMDGKKFSVSADKFILAAGGLENPRLLLASKSEHHPKGIGNKNDNVGRYYMAHVEGIYAELCFNDPSQIVTEYEKDKEGVYIRRRWWLTDKAQKKYNLGNTIFFLENPTEENGHTGALFSSVVIAKSLLSVIKQKSFKNVSPKLSKHIWNFLKKGWKEIPDIISKSLKRREARRLPSILPAANSRYWGVFFQAEQSPIRESRVTISEKEFDSLGMPRLEADIKIAPEDIESVVKAHNLFIEQFKKSNAGTYIYTEKGLRKFLDKKIKNNFTSAAHQLGTTRMSDSELTGVVDSNSKVYGIKNLYIAGSSIFPTGGHANPTLTLLATSLRLADHLKKLF